MILLDLGVSSMQLDRPERGFSYAVDAALDMRMDPSASYSARELVNETDERELADIFKRFGEERYAKQIARAIVRRRKEQPFERTGELVDVIKASIPAPARFGEGHPAKRVFQALRIDVNDELGALERALPAALQMLRPGGRLGVISFHSLEDRSSSASCGLPSTAAPARPISPSASAARSPRCGRPRGGRSGRRGRGRTEPTLPVGAPARRDEGRLRWRARRTPRPPSPSRSSARGPGPPRGRKRRQARARGGILWIAMSGILLAGVVFVNVAVLRLNLALDSANADRVKLRAENAALQSELSSRLRSAQIQAQASKQLGLVFQDPSEYGYVDLRSEGPRATGGEPPDPPLARGLRARLRRHTRAGRWLQGVSSASLGQMAQRQHRESIPIPAGRGTIFDRTGVQLAIGEQTTTIYADPRELTEPRKIAVAAHQLLGVNANELYPQLLNGRRASSTSPALPIRRPPRRS